MSDDPRKDRGHPSVEDFFARERAESPVLDGDEFRWRRIVAAARMHDRPWARYLLVAAAVLVLAGGLGWGLLRTGTGLGPSSPTTQPVVPTTPSTATHATSPAPRTSTASPSGATSTPLGTAPAGLPVPASFRLRSVTTADNSHLYALGTLPCGAGSCPALAASSDDGAGWALVHTFPSSAAPTAAAPGQPQGSGQLGDVRFASRSVGWVFGGAVLRTTDGGRTWQDYPHPGGDVLDLETDGTDVVLTVAPSCAAGTCHGAISVLRAPVSAAAATDVVGTIDGGAGVGGAPISWHADRAYVSPLVQPNPSATASGPVIVGPSGLQSAGPHGCGNGQSVQLVAPASGPTLFAVCPSTGAAGHVGYAVESSTDGGATWAPVSADRLVLVAAGHISVAAADGSSLLAVSGGSADLHGSMMVSTDGGATWTPPPGAPPLPTAGWSWVGAPGGPVYYALSADTPGGYWKSTDRGATWTRVSVASP